MSHEQFRLDLLRRINDLEAEIEDLEGIEIAAGPLQVSIEDEGVDKGKVEKIDFTGTRVAASKSGSLGTVDVDAAGGGGGNDFVFLEEKVVTGADALKINFTSISSAYRHLFFFMFGQSDAAETRCGFELNGNTGSIEGARYLASNAGGKTSSFHTFGGFLIVGNISSSSEPSTVGSGTWALIPYYTNGTYQNAAWGFAEGNEFNELYEWDAYYYNSPKAVVNRVEWRMRVATDKFKVGTTVRMYGIT